MSACRNLITGDVMANVKGNAEAFAAGLDFAKQTEWLHDCNQPRLLQTQQEVDEVNAIPVPPAMKVTWKVGEYCYWHRVVGGMV